MDEYKLREIIESLPEKRSRSRLEPYRQLIAELRRPRHTYREIANLLGEECQVQVSAGSRRRIAAVVPLRSKRTTASSAKATEEMTTVAAQPASRLRTRFPPSKGPFAD